MRLERQREYDRRRRATMATKSIATIGTREQDVMRQNYQVVVVIMKSHHFITVAKMKEFHEGLMQLEPVKCVVCL